MSKNCKRRTTDEQYVLDKKIEENIYKFSKMFLYKKKINCHVLVRADNR